jgi:hypothetical protein
MQLLMNIIPECRCASHDHSYFCRALFEFFSSVEEANVLLEAYLRRKQARVKVMFVLLTNSFLIVQCRRLCPTPHKLPTAPDIPSAFLAISDSGDFPEPVFVF